MRRHLDEVRLSKKQRILLEQLAKQQLNSTNPAERIAAEQLLYTKLVQQRPDDQFELPEVKKLLVDKKKGGVADSGDIRWVEMPNP